MNNKIWKEAIVENTSKKWVNWFKNPTNGKATGMIQFTLSEDSSNNKILSVSTQSCGIHLNEIDQVIKQLQKFKSYLK